LCVYREVFEKVPSNAPNHIFFRKTPVAMATKFGIKLGINRFVWEISARFVRLQRGFWGCAIEWCLSHFPPIDFRCHDNEIWGCAIECCQSHFPPFDPRCHGNEICDKIGYNSVCVRDICEICASTGGFSRMCHRMLPIAFFADRPLLPWQRNLWQNWL